MTFPDCFMAQVYPVSPALPGQGAKWPSQVVALQRYPLTFLCLRKVHNDFPRLFHGTGISRKPCFAQARYKVTFPGYCIAKILYPFFAWERYRMTFPACFMAQVYPVSPALPGLGTKWPPQIVALQRYLLTFLCLGEVQTDFPRLFHGTGISHKPCFARARYEVTFPGCCMKRYLLLSLPGKGTEWPTQTVSLHNYIT